MRRETRWVSKVTSVITVGQLRLMEDGQDSKRQGYLLQIQIPAHGIVIGSEPPPPTRLPLPAGCLK